MPSTGGRLSDTGSAEKNKRRGCCGKVVVAALLLGALFAGYVGYALHASHADAPLAFEPIGYRPLEKPLVTAKFEFLELPGRLLGAATDLDLNQREVNLLLFGDAGHTKDSKAQVILDGDLMKVEASRPKDGGGYLNLVATVRPSIAPTGAATIEIVDAKVGGYSVDPLTRRLLQTWLEREFAAARGRDARLTNVKALWVEKGRVRLVYDPPK